MNPNKEQKNDGKPSNAVPKITNMQNLLSAVAAAPNIQNPNRISTAENNDQARFDISSISTAGQRSSIESSFSTSTYDSEFSESVSEAISEDISSDIFSMISESTLGEEDLFSETSSIFEDESDIKIKYKSSDFPDSSTSISDTSEDTLLKNAKLSTTEDPAHKARWRTELINELNEYDEHKKFIKKLPRARPIIEDDEFELYPEIVEKNKLSKKMLKEFLPEPLRIRLNREGQSCILDLIDQQQADWCPDCLRRWEDDEPDEPWMFEPRTDKDEDFVGIQFFVHLNRHAIIDAERREAHMQFLRMIKTCMKTIDIIEATNRKCIEVTKRLGFCNKFENIATTLNDEQLTLLTDGYSITGSLMWLVTYSLRYIEFDKYDMNLMFVMLSNLIGHSIEVWSAILHEFYTAEIVIKSLEYSIVKHLFWVRGYTLGNSSFIPMSDARRQKLIAKELKRLFHRHRARRQKDIDTMKKFVDNLKWSDDREIPNTQIRIVGKFEGDESWHHLNKFPNVPKINTIKLVMQKITEVTNEFIPVLTKMDTTLTNKGRKRKEKNYVRRYYENLKLAGEKFDTNTQLDAEQDTETIYEAAKDFRELVHNLGDYPLNLLSEEEVSDLHEMGLVVLDKAEELAYSLLALKKLGREAKHIHHLCYEYIRVFYKWPIKPYDSFSNVVQSRFLRAWEHNRNFKASEIDLPIFYPIPLFNTSMHQNIMKLVPFELTKFQIKTELCLTQEKCPGLTIDPAIFNLALGILDPKPYRPLPCRRKPNRPRPPKVVERSSSPMPLHPAPFKPVKRTIYRELNRLMNGPDSDDSSSDDSSDEFDFDKVHDSEVFADYDM